jgi:hypothetical protein
MRFDRAAATARAAGEEQVIVAKLEPDRRVFLENILVERRGFLAVDAVRAEVVHEK